MGLEDKTRLSRTYGGKLGKASITGYCVKFRRTNDIDLDVFKEIVADHLGKAPAVGP